MINKLLSLIPKPKKLHIIVMILSLCIVALLTNNYQYGLMTALFLGILKEILDWIVKKYPKLKKYTKYIGVNGTGFNFKDICLWDMIGIVLGTAIYYLIKLFI
jgi:hypothetical protein